MIQYVEFVADYICMMLIDEKIFNVENPFPWMNLISVGVKQNFFELKSSNYSKTACITSSEQTQIAFDEDF